MSGAVVEAAPVHLLEHRVIAPRLDDRPPAALAGEHLDLGHATTLAHLCGRWGQIR